MEFSDAEFAKIAELCRKQTYEYWDQISKERPFFKRMQDCGLIPTTETKKTRKPTKPMKLNNHIFPPCPFCMENVTRNAVEAIQDGRPVKFHRLCALMIETFNELRERIQKLEKGGTDVAIQKAE